MPRALTAEERTQLDRNKNARAIRMAIFEAAFVIGAILLLEDVDKFWPEYSIIAFSVATGARAACGWLS